MTRTQEGAGIRSIENVGVSCIFEDPDGNLLSAYGLVAKSAWEKRK